MTDKQIIIDGVDVSGCELYRADNGVFAPDGTAERTELCYLTNDYCGNNPNCYYKQLKRKEQECEELRSKNNYSPEVLKQCPHYKNDNICTYLGYETKCEGDCNYTTFQDFIAEIDDLKNVNSKLQQQLDQLKAENEELKKAYARLNSLYNDNCDFTGKLEKTLTEIKEIAQFACEKSVCDRNHCDYCSDGQILQKISECEENNDMEN